MTATNHALTGAVIALTIKQPALAVVLAFASHFLLDALPHFGVTGDVLRRNRLWFFRLVWPLDVLLLIFLFGLVIVAHGEDVNLLVVLAAMCAAAAPDLAWAYRFSVKEKWGKLDRSPMNAFNHFHARIQWGERPWGIFIEIAWLICMGSVLLRLLL